MPRNKLVKANTKYLKRRACPHYSVSRIAMFGAIPIVTMAVEIINNGLYHQNYMAHALTYQNSVGIEFTFNPTVAISVSDNLTIDNLSPGNSADSNIITVSTASNSIAGYTMYATVGSDNSTSPYYQTSDLKNSSNIFSMIPKTDLGLASLGGDNTWGYKYSTDSGITWSNYNGLPLVGNNTLALIDTSSASSSSIQFKIGAKAGASQVSGTYSNIINFTAVTKILTTNYTISYIDNSGEATGMPSGTSGSITSNTNLTLSSTTPTRDGYTFAGWCTATTSDDTCSGTTYQPGDTYILNNTGGNVAISLYAMWGSNASLVDFYIQKCDIYGNCSNRETYHAEENMTWADWIESDYNTWGNNNSIEGSFFTNELIVHDDHYITIETCGQDGICDTSIDGGTMNNPGGYYEHGSSYVLPSDIIQSGWIYNLSEECLTGGHLVTMADGSYKRLDQIKCGDMVKSYDWSTMKLIPKKVVFTDANEGKSHTEYDEWTYSDGTIIKTVHRHEFYNAEAKRFKYMDEWQLGEHTYKEDGTHPELVAHRLIKKTVLHYKITLEGGTNFFANGLLTGDRHNPHDIVL